MINVNYELEKMLKEVALACYKLLHRIYWKELKKTMKNLSQDRWSPGQSITLRTWSRNANY